MAYGVAMGHVRLRDGLISQHVCLPAWRCMGVDIRGVIPKAIVILTG